MQFLVVIFWMQISDNFKSMKSHSGKQTCKWHTTERALKAGALVLTTCGSTAKVIYVKCPLCAYRATCEDFYGPWNPF